MTPAIMVGDSGMRGSMSGGRLPYPPYAILSHEQGLWDFTDDYSHGGASFAGVLSDDPVAREGSGMPGGITFKELVETNPCVGVLISLGGNDDIARPDELINNIIRMYTIVHQAGKVCAFVGVPDISAAQSWDNTAGSYGSMVEYMQRAAAVAHNADLVKQTCVMYEYPYIDIRNAVPADMRDITGDYVHPNQRYCTEIWKHVARCLVAAY